MLIITALSLLSVLFFYKEFLVTSFDPGFARVSGIPAELIHYCPDAAAWRLRW